MSRVSRRSLIKNAGATVVVGPHIGAMPGAAQTIGKGTDAFDHVVVLMLENRSFDKLLGYLYEAGRAPRDKPSRASTAGSCRSDSAQHSGRPS